MFKKEYLVFFIVIGLAVVYALFAFLVFITRGKSPSIVKSKIAMALKIITITGLINSVVPLSAQEATPPAIIALYAVFTSPEVTPAPSETMIALPLYGIIPDITPIIVPPYGIFPTPDVSPVPSETVVVMPLYGIIVPVMGDVNSDGIVDIVDAMKIAQYYVGLDPKNFNPAAADVNNSGNIDIVDALLVAQKYVGLISDFPKP